MKSIYLLLNLIFFANLLLAQNTHNFNVVGTKSKKSISKSPLFKIKNDVDDSFVQGEFSLYGGLGIKKLGIEADELIYSFTDDSPSRDYIEGIVDLDRTSLSVLFNFGAGYFLTDQIEAHFEINGMLGKIRGSQVTLGANYLIPFDQFDLMPGVDLAFYNSRKYIGDIINNDQFIQINSEKIYESSARVYYRNTTVALKPHVKLLTKPLNGNGLRAFASLGYDLTLSRGSAYLQFTGDDETGEPVTGTKQVNSNNFNYFYVDDEENYSSILNASGISLRVGVYKTLAF